MRAGMMIRSDDMTESTKLNVFNPTQMKAMSEAFQQTCDALRFALEPVEAQEQQGTRTKLAKIVMEVAGTGERDPKRIADAALAQMPPLQANWE
jgi:hypothetical protein